MSSLDAIIRRAVPTEAEHLAADHAVIPAQGLMRNFQIGAKPRNARGLCG